MTKNHFVENITYIRISLFKAVGLFAQEIKCLLQKIKKFQIKYMGKKIIYHVPFKLRIYIVCLRCILFLGQKLKLKMPLAQKNKKSNGK